MRFNKTLLVLVIILFTAGVSAAQDKSLGAIKGKVRVVRSGCLDVCAFGPNMMIWPEGLWYMKVTKTDVPQIVDTYLKLEESGQAKEVGAAAK